MPKREEVTGGQRKFHDEELHDLFFSPYYSGDQIKEHETDRACDALGSREKYRTFYYGNLTEGDHF